MSSIFLPRTDGERKLRKKVEKIEQFSIVISVPEKVICLCHVGTITNNLTVYYPFFE